jgi:predicted AlkP superfamily phosphohydrolase/phosphomutase
MFFKKKERFMVIGIDGVPYELVKDFTRKGIMPNAKKLIEKYGLVKTKAPLPEVSSVSWTSFMTGMNPGEHGIYGFMELNRNNYSYTFPSFRTLPVKPVWEEIGSQKKRSIIINLPNTYPVRPLNGILVCGFVALDLEKAVYPITILPLLKSMDYQVDVDTAVGRSDKMLFLKELNEVLQMRYNLYKKLGKKEKWDLFFFIITGTDRLHHFLFDAVDNPGSIYHQGFLDYYREVDQIIGEITTDIEKRGIPFIILSDHGFVKINKEVYISQYLKEWGYLDLENEKPKNLKSMTEKTKIFALDPSRLYIHLEGKYSKGSIKEEDYQKLREEIKEKFFVLEIDGEKVIKQVFYKEDIYNGKYLDNAPDLVLLANDGFDLKSGVTKSSLYGKTFFTGMHSRDNALLIDSYGFDLNDHPYIYDIGKKLKEFF